MEEGSITSITVDPSVIEALCGEAGEPLRPGAVEALRAQGLVEGDELTDDASSWLAPLRAPDYVIRVERSAMGVTGEQVFYTQLGTRTVRASAEPDGIHLEALDTSDLVYTGLMEAASIWPGTHPPLDLDRVAPSRADFDDTAIVTRIVTARPDADGVEVAELRWIEAEDGALWLVGEGTDDLSPTDDVDLYKHLPYLFRVEDR